MDYFMQLIDFILHVDRYLEMFVANYGAWVYALLFLIVFVETGLVVMPFLPGDSLLFVVGTLCGTGLPLLALRGFEASAPIKIELALRQISGQTEAREPLP